MISFSFTSLAHGQGKPLPAAGDAPAAAVAAKLQNGLRRLRSAMPAEPSEQLADVRVLTRAVELALEHDLFYAAKDAETAERLLELAAARLRQQQDGVQGLRLLGASDQPLDEPQLLVGGFVSRIDDSVQPFGLVVPAGWTPDDTRPRRLDVWLHGRGDSKTELQFLRERLDRVGQYTPPDTFVLHPFGRHCNAFKFAGETDVYEALAHVRKRLPVDADRISIRGFSMGGAGCWHLAVHDPDQWLAANPGAGFVDTIVYQGWADKMPFTMSDPQRLLLNWYDCLPWTGNLRNLNVIAYSGEVDKQRQAAARMEKESKKRGIEWPHVIGAGMGHKIDEPSAERISAQLAEWAAEENPAVPKRVDLTTYTLRYHRCDWLSIEGMEEHWSETRVRGELVSQTELALTTQGATHLALDFPAGSWPRANRAVTLRIDGTALAAPPATADQPYHCDLIKTPQGWSLLAGPDRSLRKRPGLQGPIDDALTERFVFVKPSRPCWHGRVERWTNQEWDYARTRWRRLMRGNVRQVGDEELDPETLRDSNLILFGDPHANQLLARILPQLPIEWTKEEIRVGDRVYDASTHSALMVFPNPLNPQRYVVLNSGMTFRDFSNVSNSRQIAMLPDWAVVDVTEGATDLLPGKVRHSGFFDERWQQQP